jgi:TolA-binding protein
MRYTVFFLGLAIAGAVPASAQQVPLDRRLDRLEQEMRAVQRRVFPTGATATVDPEIQPEQRPQPAAATGDAVSSLTGRIEALEAQLARVTGQVEETGYRVRQIDEQMRQLRSDFEARIARLEQAAAPPAPAVATPTTVDEPAADPRATDPRPDADDPRVVATDPAEAAYNAGFRLWEQRRYADAQRALTAAGERYATSRWASWSRNLAGRAYLDDNKPATAARIFLSNYQTDPRGERAADSLFFLGEALVRLNRRSEACRVYDELAANYPNMRAWLRERLPAARRTAGCSR